MATYYVGQGGSDAADGLSWANRFLTLNGAEDEPVAAGDTVYVGPGVYREMLTVDVAGSAGNEITYIGDVTGENTDGVGGIVRITGSDNDQTATRSNCITISSGEDYRVFRGFMMDTTTSYLVDLANADDCTFEDCVMQNASICLQAANTSQNLTVRRCIAISGDGFGLRCIRFDDGGAGDQSDVGHVLENSIFRVGAQGATVGTNNIGGITIKNCLILGGGRGVDTVSLASGQQVDVNNCILYGCYQALYASASGEIVEDYNTIYGCVTNRTNTSTGSNSQTYPPLWAMPMLLDGYKFTPPLFPFELSQWSEIATIAGTGEATDDIFGMTRPTTSAKKSWGPGQFANAERATSITRGASTASIKLNDAGRHQMFVPVTNTSTTFEVYVYREGNYSGTNPQMIIKQPGQADDTTTDAGAASQWNQLTTTLTPSADTDFVVVELVSNNAAGFALYGGSDAVYFDDLSVS